MTCSGINNFNKSSGKISSVRREAAVGIITFDKTLYFSPSSAKAFAKPMRPVLAKKLIFDYDIFITLTIV